MEHFLIIKLIFWIALFAFIFLTALICALVEKLVDREKSPKRKIHAHKANEAAIVGADDSLDRAAA